MIVIICVDDNNGMMFNHRRQSQDRIQREQMLEMVGDGKLWVNSNSKMLFSNFDSKKIVVDDDFMEKAGQGEYCFVEDVDVSLYSDRIEEVVLYKWNRSYPTDFWFSMNLSGWKMIEITNYSGSSHEKITRERYRK